MLFEDNIERSVVSSKVVDKEVRQDVDEATRARWVIKIKEEMHFMLIVEQFSVNLSISSTSKNF